MMSKLLPPTEVAEFCRQQRACGRRIAFTNGCFDLLHTGHARYLEEASRLADVLIVGVNGDASVQAIKGPDRPLIPLDERLLMLAALESVDVVTWFDEPTPEALIRAIRPDIHAKGGDYRLEDLEEAQLVRELGGEVVVLSLVEDRSTTWLLERIRERLLGQEG